MVMLANGSGSAVPLAIYPPGFNLSGFIIFDPTTGEWINGSGYSVKQASLNTTQTSGMQPLDDSGTDSTSDPGFYQVVRDGVHLWGLTNGMVLSNEVITPIEIAWTNNTDQIVGFSFYDANTNPLIGAVAVPLGSNNIWFLEWNTTMSFNGDYNIYAELDFASNDPVVSAPVTVTVNNLISFPNELAQTYGNQMWIYAQTIPNANFQLDMYDQNTNYLGSFTGAADPNGVISFLWNFVDYNGNLTSSSTYYGFYTVDTSSLTNSGAMQQTFSAPAVPFQTTPPTFKSLSSLGGASPQGSPSTPANAQYFWSAEGAWSDTYHQWVVAYGQFNANSTQVFNDQSMIDGYTVSQGGIMQVLDPQDTGLVMSPGNHVNNSVFTVNSAASAGQWLGYITDYHYRDFYFFGHGNNHYIGSYLGGASGLSMDQLSAGLGNVPLSYQYTVPPFWSITHPWPWTSTVTIPTTMQHAALHPYRFVYVDACDTGAGNFCNAFGVPAATLSTNDFNAVGRVPRVFIGFKHTTYNWNLFLGYSGYSDYSQMTYNFIQAWVNGRGNAQTIVNVAQQDSWPTGRTYANMDSFAVEYGAADMFYGTPPGQ